MIRDEAWEALCGPSARLFDKGDIMTLGCVAAASLQPITLVIQGAWTAAELRPRLLELLHESARMNVEERGCAVMRVRVRETEEIIGGGKATLQVDGFLVLDAEQRATLQRFFVRQATRG